MYNKFCVLTDEQLAEAKRIAAELETALGCRRKSGVLCHDCWIYLTQAECPLTSLESLIEMEDCRREIKDK